MKKIKLTRENMDSIFSDWKQSEINRDDELYFLESEINISEIQNTTSKMGILIDIQNVSFIKKIIFIDILN